MASVVSQTYSEYEKQSVTTIPEKYFASDLLHQLSPA